MGIVNFGPYTYLKLRLLQFQNEIDKVIHNLKFPYFNQYTVLLLAIISNIISSIIITMFDFQKKVIHTKLTHKIVLMPMIVTPMTINCVVDEPIPSFKYEVADFYTRGRQIYPNRRTKKKTRVGRFVASKVRLLSLCYTVHGVHMSVNLMLVYGKKK